MASNFYLDDTPAEVKNAKARIQNPEGWSPAVTRANAG